MKQRHTNLAILICAGLLAACGSEFDASQSELNEAWDSRNAPFHLVPGYEADLAKLPESGMTDIEPWSDTYWPSYRGGLADRWQDSASSAFTNTQPTKRQVRRMGKGKLNKLSPAEKYDLLIGDYSYQLTNYELERTSPDNPTWFGLCHGWAPAAINFKEPRSIEVELADGKKIDFLSSDIKALLTFAQQYDGLETEVKFLGGRCDRNLSEDDKYANDPECRDVNAGSFHLSLANEVGLNKRAFVADVTRDAEVWNQPVYGFNSKVVSESSDIYESAAAGTVKIVEMKTVMKYTVEVEAHAEAIGAKNVGQRAEKTYRYFLELDGAGEIIGGEWITEDRPDFLWSQTRPQFSGFFAELEQLYMQATK